MAWGLLAQALHKFFYLKHLPIVKGGVKLDHFGGAKVDQLVKG